MREESAMLCHPLELFLLHFGGMFAKTAGPRGAPARKNIVTAAVRNTNTLAQVQ
jgi:hypothetical protein